MRTEEKALWHQACGWLRSGDARALARSAGHPIWQWRSAAKPRNGWIHTAPHVTVHAPLALDFLMSEGLDVNQPNRLGCTPLHVCFMAPRSHRRAWVDPLVLAGANVHALDINGRSAWRHALFGGDPDGLAWLAAKAVVCQPADREGLTLNIGMPMWKAWWAIQGPPSLDERTHLFVQACRQEARTVAHELMQQTLDMEVLSRHPLALAKACQHWPFVSQKVADWVKEGLEPACLSVEDDANGQTLWQLAGAGASANLGLQALLAALAEGQRRRLETGIPSPLLSGARFLRPRM